VVPGNHDAWLRLRGALKILTRWRSYTDRRQLFRKCFPTDRAVHALVVNGQSVIVTLVDSNELADSFSNRFNLRNALGGGTVGTHQIADILDQYQALLNQTIGIPEGFSPDGALHLGVLHHHPAIPAELPLDLEQVLLRLSDADAVQDLFQDHLRTDLVLCGHQHFPYLFPAPGNHQRPWLSCAGTATQCENPINSFKVYWYYATPTRLLEVEEYRLERGTLARRFQPQPRVPILL